MKALLENEFSSFAYKEIDFIPKMLTPEIERPEHPTASFSLKDLIHTDKTKRDELLKSLLGQRVVLRIDSPEKWHLSGTRIYIQNEKTDPLEIIIDRRRLLRHYWRFGIREENGGKILIPPEGEDCQAVVLMDPIFFRPALKFEDIASL